MKRCTTPRYSFAVPGLQCSATCSLRWRAATSATVTVEADFPPGSSPLIKRAMVSAALRRAWSAEITPWRPSVIRLDLPFALVHTTYDPGAGPALDEETDARERHQGADTGLSSRRETIRRTI